jgi:hypothetical protein
MMNGISEVAFLHGNRWAVTNLLLNQIKITELNSVIH